MAINNSYDEAEVVQAIAKALETFYGKLTLLISRK